MPVFVLVVTSLEVSTLLIVVMVTHAFIPSDDVIKPHFGIHDLITTQSD